MDKLRKILTSGGAVVLPTETVYGLFAQALNEEAVNSVYQLKQRPRDKAMNLNVSNLNDIIFFSQNTPFFLEKLYNRFMPGPLTIILKANDNVPFWVNSGLDTVGFRVPNHVKTLQLISETGPLIGPSANISGNESGKKFSDIQAQFSVDLPGIEDDQALTGIDSTILDLSGQKARILPVENQDQQDEEQQHTVLFQKADGVNATRSGCFDCGADGGLGHVCLLDGWGELLGWIAGGGDRSTTARNASRAREMRRVMSGRVMSPMRDVAVLAWSLHRAP